MLLKSLLPRHHKFRSFIKPDQNGTGSALMRCAREKAKQKAIEQGDPMLAAKIAGFQFRDIRPKAASEILDIGDASLLLGHSKQEITKRAYRRIGATAKPSK